MTDRELAERAMAYLRKTTAKYSLANEKNLRAYWGKAFAELKQIGAAPPPPPPPAPGLPVATHRYPPDMLGTHKSDNGLWPVFDMAAGKMICESTGAPGVSRGHYVKLKKIGEPLFIRGRMWYPPKFRGTAIRVETTALPEANQHRLELDRWPDSQNVYHWHVVRNRNKSDDPNLNEHETILGPFLDAQIPVGAHVEIRGVLSPVDGQALTVLLVNGLLLDSTIEHNWPGLRDAERYRWGIVEGWQNPAGRMVFTEIECA
jgi:hypothetical protein